MTMLREAEDELRQLQLKEQEQLELDRQRQLSNRASSTISTGEELTTTVSVMPSAPPDTEPPLVVPSSSPPTIPPPSYTSVIHVDQKPTIPNRDLKPTSASMTYVFLLSTGINLLILFPPIKNLTPSIPKVLLHMTWPNLVIFEK